MIMLRTWELASQHPDFEPLGLLLLLAAAFGLGRLVFYLRQEG
jgi:hypothetical protein